MYKDDDLDSAIALNKSGKKDEAREILNRMLHEDPRNDRAWMWLADTYSDNPSRIEILEGWLKNNPNNQIAQKGLATLKAEEAKKGKTKKCPYCAGMIQDDAVVCGFCGRDLPETGTVPPNAFSPGVFIPGEPPIPAKPKQKKSITKKVILFVTGGVILLCLLCLALSLIYSSTPQAKASATKIAQTRTAAPTKTKMLIRTGAPSFTPSITYVPTETHVPTETLVPTETSLPPTKTPNYISVAAGTYLVGSEIQPGIYKGKAGRDVFDSCYWERIKNLSGDLDSIIANDNSLGQFYVEILN